jgi:Tol biopolymer transport system component
MTELPAATRSSIRVAAVPLCVALIALALLFLLAPVARAQAPLVGRLYLISKSAGGTIGNNQSYQPDVSTDGRYVVFASDATNFVTGDNNGSSDIFVVDRQENRVEIVSVQSDGDPSNGNSYQPSISGDGRWVAFCSFASNLVGGDDNGRPDTFLYDRQNDAIRRISDAPNTDDGNGNSCGQTSLSNDGQFVAFISDASNLVISDTNNVRDVFLYERGTDQVRRVNAPNGQQPNGGSDWPSISSDGRYVAFESVATNLVGGDDNGQSDVFVWDRIDADVERASERQDGADNTTGSFRPAISGDSRFVVFQADDGLLVANDSNGKTDIFLHVRDGNAIERVSLESDGGQPNDNSTQASISDDGRYVSFTSAATDLDDRSVNLTNIFVRDRSTGTIFTVSYTTDDVPGNRNSDTPQISGNGRYVAFASAATNLLPEDPNERADVYLWDREAAPPAEPSFTVTPSVGRAGTVFTAQILGFVPGSSVAISVNGANVGTMTTDSNGSALFGLNSSNANDGRYYVRVFDGTNDMTAVFVVAINAPLVGGTPPVIFPIPPGIAYGATYLPYVVVNR